MTSGEGCGGLQFAVAVARVMLVDDQDDGNRGGDDSEGLYINTIIRSADCCGISTAP